MSDKEPEDLLEEIDNALNGEYFEEFYSVDNASYNDGVQIIPPNALINQEFEISLLELKELLEEWIVYVNNN